MISIDIKDRQYESDGIAYFRMENSFMEFMKKVEKTHDVIGFDYDGSRNLGIIIKKK